MFIKGNPNHWTKLPSIEETRKKISNSLKGKPSPNKRHENYRECRICKKTCRLPLNRLTTFKYCSKKCRCLSLKGHVPWNKGLPSKRWSGKNNPNWKGGITKYTAKIRRTIEYKKWRESVFKRDNYTCQFCGKRGGGRLEADHIIPQSISPHLRFDVNNGRTLCVSCHRKTETYSTKIKKYINCTPSFLVL